MQGHCTSVCVQGICTRGLLLHEGWCTSVVQGCCTLGVLLHKQLCTSVPSCTSSGAQVHCTKGRLLHRDVARVCCTRAHLLHKGWCSRPLHDDPALALAHPVAQGSTPCSCITCASRCCTRALHKSSASSVVLHKPLHKALCNRTIARWCRTRPSFAQCLCTRAPVLHEGAFHRTSLHEAFARGPV